MLNGKKELVKPKKLEKFGYLTILHVAKAEHGAEHVELVWEWARDVWNAYRVYHDLAVKWIEEVKISLY